MSRRGVINHHWQAVQTGSVVTGATRTYLRKAITKVLMLISCPRWLCSIGPRIEPEVRDLLLSGSSHRAQEREDVQGERIRVGALAAV